MVRASSEPQEPSGEGSTPAPGAVERQLERIFSSEAFVRSERLKSFLSYVVRQHLLKDDASLKEYTVGVEVFGKPVDFDPQGDSTVRVGANRLRSELEKYYAASGQSDEVLITLPRGHYVPEIVWRYAGTPPAPQHPHSRDRRKVVLAAVGAALIAAIPTVALRSHMIRPRVLPPVVPGRLLVHATTEGETTRHIRLTHEAQHLALSPDGRKLFATEDQGRTLSIVDTESDTVMRTLTLPRDIGALTVSAQDVLYIASPVDGLFMADTTKDKLLPQFVETGGPVWDIAVTPDGEKLFMAMGGAGLKRLSTRSRHLSTVSDRTCPEHLAIDSAGKNLYVSYQCSGPAGRRGHDSMEVFDVEREVSVGIVSGPPMVGGSISTSPDGKLVVIDAFDACLSSGYDHENCPSVPARVFYLIRTADRRLLHQFAFPVEPGKDTFTSPHFVDNSRFLLLGDSLLVEDATNYTALERAEAGSIPSQAVAFSVDGRRAWLGESGSNSISVLELEGADCSPPRPGLSMFFPADGTNEDSVGGAVLDPHGTLRFTAGRVGQAFLLDGTNSLSTSWTGHFQDGAREMSLALYVKFAGIEGERVLIDWTGENPRRGLRLLKGDDNRLLLQSWPGGGSLQSKTFITAGAWYHLAVTRTDQEMVLYVNGEPEARGSSAPQLIPRIDRPLLFGALASGQPSLRGLMDEILGYNRALTDLEVKALYRLRESGSCRP